MFEGMKNVETSIDDIVIWGTDTKSHLQTVTKVLDICIRNNVTPKREKCLIAAMELTFLTNQLPTNGWKSDPAKEKPIVEFTTPKEQVNIARFLGIVK